MLTASPVEASMFYYALVSTFTLIMQERKKMIMIIISRNPLKQLVSSATKYHKLERIPLKRCGPSGHVYLLSVLKMILIENHQHMMCQSSTHDVPVFSTSGSLAMELKR